jgi:excisionase family DNA binding protein
MSTVTKLAYTIAEAAEATGYSEKTIRRAIDAGDLVVRYGTKTKPVVKADELEAWLDSLPTTPPSKEHI